MATVNILEAKTHFSRLVERVETGADAEIIIARNRRPVARLVPLAAEYPGIPGIPGGIPGTDHSFLVS
jgi:prevent-host-death family protein